jgi:callose synthase
LYLGVELAAGLLIFCIYREAGQYFGFMFHIQTKANYMAQTILVGGAKYRPTG